MTVRAPGSYQHHSNSNLPLDYLLGPNLDRPDLMEGVLGWDAKHSSEKYAGLVVSRDEYRKLELDGVPIGWIIFPDGARRSNAASASEKVEVPENKLEKWKRIALYRHVFTNRLYAEAQELHHTFMLQTTIAERDGNGRETPEEEINSLEKLIDRYQVEKRRLASASKMVRKFSPKNTKAFREMEQENSEAALEAKLKLEDLGDSLRS
jgi:hypothetical protein